jgi:sugar O-acyltransferase (sialic acid O-acetyltransferase NeuD family)
MSKPVAIIGTRSGADGLLQAASDMGLQVAGWFDQYFAGNTQTFAGLPILGSELDIDQSHAEQYDFFLGSFYAGNPVLQNPAHNGQALRLSRIKLIREKQLPLVNLIAASAYVHPSSQLGQGVFVGHNCIIRADCRIGDFAYFCHASGIGHHVQVKDNVILMAHAVTSADVLLEENVMIGINATVVNGYYDQELTVGRNSKIAAGAVVYKNVDADKFVSVQGRVMQKLDNL